MKNYRRSRRHINLKLASRPEERATESRLGSGIQGRYLRLRETSYCTTARKNRSLVLSYEAAEWKTSLQLQLRLRLSSKAYPGSPSQDPTAPAPNVEAAGNVQQYTNYAEFHIFSVYYGRRTR